MTQDQDKHQSTNLSSDILQGRFDALALLYVDDQGAEAGGLGVGGSEEADEAGEECISCLRPVVLRHHVCQSRTAASVVDSRPYRGQVLVLKQQHRQLEAAEDPSYCKQGNSSDLTIVATERKCY